MAPTQVIVHMAITVLMATTALMATIVTPMGTITIPMGTIIVLMETTPMATILLMEITIKAQVL